MLAFVVLQQITEHARPIMGPNMYVTPPASFTTFHQDGNGTVDSGHLCLSGYNEVVLLRRLTERHKKHALMILTGNAGTNEYFDGLYELPHSDELVRTDCYFETLMSYPFYVLNYLLP